MKKKKKIQYIVFFAALFLSLFVFCAKAEENKAQKMKVQVKFVQPENGEKKVVPRIDEEAAATVKADESNTLKQEKNIYSINFWLVLFGAYVFLLIFNLSFDFQKKKEIQWFLEAMLTFLAIFVWDQLDFGRANSWFPAVVLETGIIVYGFYLCLFRCKTMIDTSE